MHIDEGLDCFYVVFFLGSFFFDQKGGILGHSGEKLGVSLDPFWGSFWVVLNPFCSISRPFWSVFMVFFCEFFWSCFGIFNTKPSKLMQKNAKICRISAKM